MIPDRIEYLLMLARDERTENDTLIDKQNEIFSARAIRLLQLEELHQETGRIIQEELKRFARWMPKDVRPPSEGQRFGPNEKIPRVVSQGPMPQMSNLATKEK